jgi:nicotinamidase-related amidase
MTSKPVQLGEFAANAWWVDGTTVDLTRRRPEPDTVIVDAEPQQVGLDLARTAFVVIDLQNDFTAEGGWVHSRGRDVSGARAPIGPVNALTPLLRERNVPIIWLNWGNRSDRANLPPSILHVVNPTGQGTGIGDPLPDSSGRVLQGNTWSTELDAELITAPTDLHVSKYRISGFWDTELDSILRNLGVTTLLFGGVNTDQCVLATIIDAACIGYDAILLTDCAATSSPDYCTQAVIYNVRGSIGFVTDSAALARAIK